MQMFKPLTTARLMLRRFVPADAPALAGYRNLPEVSSLQMWDGYSLSDAHNLIATMQPQPTQDQWYQVAVTLNGQLIGDLAFKLEDRQAEIGFSFDPKYQRQGYAHEAAIALLEYAFNELKLHRLHASTDPRNTKSIALLEKLGFRQEGHLRQNLWFKGAWADDLLFGLLKTQWLSRDV